MREIKIKIKYMREIENGVKEFLVHAVKFGFRVCMLQTICAIN